MLVQSIAIGAGAGALLTFAGIRISGAPASIPAKAPASPAGQAPHGPYELLPYLPGRQPVILRPTKS
jgi:hypothetical protein